MTCPECGGKIVSGDSSVWSTLVGYRSPPGHNHDDDNCRKRMYRCENGHDFVLSRQNRCTVKMPSGERCTWVGKDNCFCHLGKKIQEWPVVEWTANAR